MPAPALNTTFPSQKASMSPHYRESYEDGQRGGVRPPLPNYGGSPLAVAARHRPPGGFPLLQVSSWLRDDAELPELRECEQDSPFSTALLERSAGGLRKRRPKHPQRVIHQEEEEAMSGDFSVSGVRLGTQRRGGGSRLAPDLNALKAKKAFAAQSPWRHADPAALAEALTIALGQLQQSSWNEAEEELAEESNRTPEIEDTAPSADPPTEAGASTDSGGAYRRLLRGRLAFRHLAPRRRQAPDTTGAGQSLDHKKQVFAGRESRKTRRKGRGEGQGAHGEARRSSK